MTDDELRPELNEILALSPSRRVNEVREALEQRLIQAAGFRQIGVLVLGGLHAVNPDRFVEGVVAAVNRQAEKGA